MNDAMSKHAEGDRPTSIPADPSQWSDQSKQSVAFHFRRDYSDKPYTCWRCGAACVFTAQDQKYTYEVKKASINQRRIHCSACWSESHQLRAAMVHNETRWASEKSTLQTDREFLSGWLDLLTRWKEFEPYRQDVAKINMLRGLLGFK